MPNARFKIGLYGSSVDPIDKPLVWLVPSRVLTPVHDPDSFRYIKPSREKPVILEDLEGTVQDEGYARVGRLFDNNMAVASWLEGNQYCPNGQAVSAACATVRRDAFYHEDYVEQFDVVAPTVDKPTRTCQCGSNERDPGHYSWCPDYRG